MEPEKYDAALRAARERVYDAMDADVHCQCFLDSDRICEHELAIIGPTMDAYEALAKAVGAAEDMQHEGCPSNECAAKREADRLAAPYLETEESMHSKREAR